MPTATTILTDEQREHFLSRGHVVIRGAFSRDVAKEWFDWGYERIGCDPYDASTWTAPRIHLAGTKHADVREFAPLAYEAINELCGDGRAQEPLQWGDTFIFNHGFGADEPWKSPQEQMDGWHKDGDFFRHFLNSPEQGLLVIVVWSEIQHQGGGTFIACDSVPIVARYLAERPEGVLPNGFPFREFKEQCRDFQEVTGEPGDVVLLHPFVLHTISQNVTMRPRVITNPPVHLREPMILSRPDGGYSLVEQAILRALDVDHYDFQPTAERERLVPDRVRIQQEALAAEKARRGVDAD